MTSQRDYALRLLARANDDLYVARRLAHDSGAPEWTIGFHAQQAVEKALKAALCVRSVPFPRTHNLVELAELLRRDGAPVTVQDDALGMLTLYGVLMRYEDGIPDSVSAPDAMWFCDTAGSVVDWAEKAVQTAD